jgi:hypothetical protein
VWVYPGFRRTQREREFRSNGYTTDASIGDGAQSMDENQHEGICTTVAFSVGLVVDIFLH